MARADLILKLVKAGTEGNRDLFERTVTAMAADERAKKHTILADRLLAQLSSRRNGHTNRVDVTIPQSTGNPLSTEISPQRRLTDLILARETCGIVRELIDEQRRADLLRSYNVEPRNKVLLAGPPGNGKTSLAEAIAYELNVPLILPCYESIVGSYLGETAQRIGKVFEFVSSRSCVLFFDEFETLAKERGDNHETGEIKRVVSSLLLRIDAIPSYVVMVVASNHPELLDRATWRRFQIRLELPNPTLRQIEHWFIQFAEQSSQSLGIPPRNLARRLKGLSFGEIEEFGLDVLRAIILSDRSVDPKQITEARLVNWKRRFAPQGANDSQAWAS